MTRSTGAELRWTLPGELAALVPEVPERRRRTPRDWLVDVVVFGAAVAFWGHELVTSPGHVGVSPEWLVRLDPWLGAVACLTLWWRRRYPLALTWAVLPLFLLADTATGAAIALVFSAAVHRGWVAASITAGPYFVMAAWYGFAFPHPEIGRVPTMLVTALMFALPLGWGIAIRSRRQLVVALRRDAERERHDHEVRLLAARRAERDRIAREMHDVLAHRLSLLAMHAGALGYQTDRARDGSGTPLDAAEVAEAVSVIRENADAAVAELGEVLDVLRWTDADTRAPQPRLARLPALVEEARTAGQDVVFEPGDVLGHATDLRPQAQRTVYRVVQEGLTNARKHAPGMPATVRLAGAPGEELSVTVTNPLPRNRVPAAAGARAGLAGLSERVALDGGSLDHAVRADQFVLSARLPWPHDRAADRPDSSAARR